MAFELVPGTAPEASSKAPAKEDAKAAKQLSEVRARLEAAAAKAGGKKTAGGLGGAKAGYAGKGPATSGKGGDAGKATFQQRFASLATDEQMLRVSHPTQAMISTRFKRMPIALLLDEYCLRALDHMSSESFLFAIIALLTILHPLPMSQMAASVHHCPHSPLPLLSHSSHRPPCSSTDMWAVRTPSCRQTYPPMQRPRCRSCERHSACSPVSRRWRHSGVECGVWSVGLWGGELRGGGCDGWLNEVRVTEAG